MSRTLKSRVVAEPVHREHTRNFLDILSSISRCEGWSDYETFVKWLEAAACALRNPVLMVIRDQEKWDINEERYMRVVKACRYPRDTMGRMSRLLGIVAMALHASPKDFLSGVFMEVAASSEMGQFFTPSTVTELMARMTVHDAGEQLCAAYASEGRDYIRLADPACGVGGMVLAVNQALCEKGIDVATQAHWVCTDVDWRAICGAYIQTSLTGCSAQIVYGNSLSLEEWDVLLTMAAVTHPKYVPESLVQLVALRDRSLRFERKREHEIFIEGAARRLS